MQHTNTQVMRRKLTDAVLVLWEQVCHPVHVALLCDLVHVALLCDLVLVALLCHLVLVALLCDPVHVALLLPGRSVV